MIGIARVSRLPWSGARRPFLGFPIWTVPRPALGMRWASTQPKKLLMVREFRRLLKLAKPEYKLLAAAFACILVTLSVSMSLPLFIGKIIDTAKVPVAEGSENSGTKDSPTSFLGFGQSSANLDAEDPDNETILGLQPVQFYTALGALFTVGAVANFGRTYLLRLVGERLVARLRLRLFSRILCQDLYFFDVGPTKNGMKTGDLILRLASDTQIIAKTLSGTISDGARATILGLVGLLMMGYVLWKLCLCMLAIFPPLVVMLMVYGRRIKALSRTIQENLGAMTKVTEEKLNGVKTIQLFSQQQPMVHDYNSEIKRILALLLREGRLAGMYYGFNGFLGNATLIGLLVIGTKLIGMGEMTLGDLLLFMMYAVYTGLLVFGLGNFYTDTMKGIGAAERVFELMDSKPTISTSLGKKVDNLYGDVEFKGVKFAYPSRPHSSIFKGFDLKVGAGENVCLVGPLGLGKLSALQLLLRFYDPTAGEVTVNGHNIRDLNLNFYRSQLGYVQQEPLLFSGTIRDNIIFGARNALAEDIAIATELSNLAGFILALPDGLDTAIGPLNLTQLLGGQRQRISLARTLIRRPQILVLDEATLALDLISEEIVMRNLADLNSSQSVTIINIAHRLLTIKNSKRVVVFNSDGCIVEDGAFAELYANPNSELNKLLKNHSLE